MLEGQLLWTVAGAEGSARLLGYLNHARAARYDDALASAPAGSPPDLAPLRRTGATKRGVALLLEQEAGPARVFVRGSWNDGATETFAFTEIDLAASAGAVVELPGVAGGRDALGIAAAVGGISPAHARFLAAGGKGFQLGDGALRRAAETVLEAFWLVRLGRAAELTADAQAIWSPGMNADRGPAAVLGLRLHLHR
jgi:high affinity Mn2+ porin